MNKEQMQWAKQHDWFIECWVNAQNSYSVLVRHDTAEGQTLVFGHGEYAKLRAWAGY